MKYTLITLLTAALLTGCAAPMYQDMVTDMSGVDERQYSRDLIECRRYSENASVGGAAAGGAVAGALFGAALGAIFGNSDLALQVAGAGALYGAADGAGSAMQGKDQIAKNCMRGRGYRVLN